jgi:hypothetical protein
MLRAKVGGKMDAARAMGLMGFKSSRFVEQVKHDIMTYIDMTSCHDVDMTLYSSFISMRVAKLTFC